MRRSDALSVFDASLVYWSPAADTVLLPAAAAAAAQQLDSHIERRPRH